MTHRFGLFVATAMAVAGVTGCATKNYVRTETAPIIEHTNQLEEKTAANNRAIRETDERAQAGIKQAQSAADRPPRMLRTPPSQPGTLKPPPTTPCIAPTRSTAWSRAWTTTSRWPTSPSTSALTRPSLPRTTGSSWTVRAQLESAYGFLLEVTGGTDSTGPAQYNYDLSQRRADAVVQYLASKYGVPAHRFYLIGIGKDKAVAHNKTAKDASRTAAFRFRCLPT